MIKKFVFVLLLLVCPFVANAWDENTKTVWSLGAFADTMKQMRRNCEPTSQHEFIEFGNWLREKGGEASFAEMITKCENLTNRFKKIDRYYVARNGEKKECKLPSDICAQDVVDQPSTVDLKDYYTFAEAGVEGFMLSSAQVVSTINCGERNYTNNKGCNIFLSTFLKKHQENEQVRNNGKPGTYVEERSIEVSGKKLRAYKIKDVVLAPGYWEDGSNSGRSVINQEVNKNLNNTKIYLLQKTGSLKGKYVETGLYTRTNDMFLDVSSAKTDAGDLRGVAVNSYIFPDLDLTQRMYEKFNSFSRGKEGYSGVTAFDSRPGGRDDIKESWGKDYKLYGQLDGEYQANGVLFEGKIVTFDWLGNFLFGMRAQESQKPGAAEWLAELVQAKTGEEGTVETQAVKDAWYEGENWVKHNTENRDNTFEKIKKSSVVARDFAKYTFQEKYQKSERITCEVVCNNRLGTNDIVTCWDENNNYQEYVFDAIDECVAEACVWEAGKWVCKKILKTSLKMGGGIGGTMSQFIN